MRRPRLYIVTIAGLAISALAQAASGADRVDRRRDPTEVHLRVGHGQSIIAARRPVERLTRAVPRENVSYPFPQPRLSGFSPLVAIATSDAGNPLGFDFEFEQDLEPNYTGNLLNPLANPNFVIGFLDSGSDVDLAAGTFAATLGLTGANLTPNTIPIGGVGGEVDAAITMPVGFFAAGLSAVDGFGQLDFGALVGHSNVAGVAAPSIDCGNGEVLSAVVGMPFLAFYNSIVYVDTPITVNVGGVLHTGPDVIIQEQFDALPTFAHQISMEFGGLSSLATTANYYINIDDILGTPEPAIPTLMSVAPGSLPSGGAFYATLWVIEGDPAPTNPAQPMRVLVDTGAQSSIMSEAMAANLNLPLIPDFTVDVCGVGGLVEGVPGFYIDYAKLNARGGALEFSRAPFVVVDLPSPEGGSIDGILGMNFFWNRNVIFQPSLLGSAFLHVSDPIPVAFGDSDVDFDVDEDDMEQFMQCVTGVDLPTVTPACDHIDGDGDTDVDLIDFARFQTCFSGSDRPATPDCGL